jgi:hypothetical protein
LGADSSGNGNNWTPNVFLVSAGVNNDSLVDSPTSYGTDTGAGGEVRGNYATWNPLTFYSTTYPPTLTNGNLDASVPAQAGLPIALGTLVMPSGKWYWEVTITSGGAQMVGIADSTAGGANSSYTTANGWYYYSGGQRYTNNTPVNYGATYTVGDIIGVALDMDAGTLVFYKNGASQGTAYSTGLTGKTFVAVIGNGSGSVAQGYTGNFGQRAFANTAPSGFKALCTQNLPTPTIGATTATLANKYFDTALYAGNGATNVITVGFQPDFTWIKARNVATNHALFDSVRGTGKVIQSNTTAAEATDNTTLTSFDPSGFSLGAAAGSYIVNTSTYTFAAWNWRASNATAVTNTAGSITSTVSASTTSGFSVVTYTGNGTSGATIGHGLGVAPSMVIVQTRTGTNNRDKPVYHVSVGNTGVLTLNSNVATQTSSGFWNNTTPSSTVITLGNDQNTNQNSSTYVAYCFAPIAGYSAIGSYTGNGSTDGTFVFCGFRPAFLMIKRSSSTGDWFIYNSKTSLANVVAPYLVANTTGAEGTYTTLDFVSNGFKLRVSDAEVNGSGSTIIFMAFAENPFKTSLAR